MTKEEFFKKCDQADPSLAHQLYLTTERRHLDNVIVLSGSSWCRGALTRTPIYCPLPGRQGSQAVPYQEANAKIEDELIKLNRWLEEWKALHGISQPKE